MQTKNKPLTPRETEVLFDIAGDMSTREIAYKYGVTMGTVSTYRHSILRKMNCRTSAAAVMKFFGRQPVRVITKMHPTEISILPGGTYGIGGIIVDSHYE